MTTGPCRSGCDRQSCCQNSSSSVRLRSLPHLAQTIFAGGPNTRRVTRRPPRLRAARPRSRSRRSARRRGRDHSYRCTRHRSWLLREVGAALGHALIRRRAAGRAAVLFLGTVRAACRAAPIAVVVVVRPDGLPDGGAVAGLADVMRRPEITVERADRAAAATAMTVRADLKVDLAERTERFRNSFRHRHHAPLSNDAETLVDYGAPNVKLSS
jgi:hypothetical protein